MNSRFDSFLENDDRYKLFMYQILQARPGGISIGEVKKQIELSDFKFSKLVEELNEELLGMKSEIIIDSKWLLSKNLSSADYQKLQLIYFKRSMAADFLVKIGLFESISRTEFADTHFISETSVYNLQADINNILADFGLKLKNSRVVGDEKDVRSFYFQLLFNYYGGIESPFPKQTQQLVNEDITDIEDKLAMKLSTIQKNQLLILLGVQICRMRHENYIDASFPEIPEAETFLEVIQNGFSLREIPQTEGKYLYLYLLLNNFVTTEQNFESTKLEKKIMTYLDDNLRISTFDSYEAIKREVVRISQKWFYFRITSTTFISDQQLEFFAQSYPILHKLIYEFVTDINRIDGNKISRLEKNHLYFELMFCLLPFKEVLNNELPIRVFVDFSGGKNYNYFISENIEYFRYLNIQLLDEINDQVDIYVSDFADARLTCEQIIWKSPPMDTDWEKFANTVVELKGSKQ